ncbi:MAG: transglycosylase domain-containing protein [Pseudomonadota bacterium]
MTRTLRHNAWLKKLLLAIALASLLFSVALIGYLVSLDRQITSTFEGRRWSVPAVVYARPLELYAGVPLGRRALLIELERVGYQRTPGPPLPGEYRVEGNRLELHLRAFRFAEGPRPAQRVNLTIEPEQITALADDQGKPRTLIRVDPPSIGSIYPSHGEDRVVLTPEQVPELLRGALKVVEDQRFDSHHGFDWRGIARAFWVNVRSGSVRQGGSTLTQQLVKSYFLSDERTLERKLKELAMAVVLEARFSKGDLMNAYINEIYLGQAGERAIHGFGLGAQFYFNKPLNELALAELATLVAIIRGPSYYNPYRHPQRLIARRDRILASLAEAQLIDPAAATSAQAAPLTVTTGKRRGGTYYPAFMDLVREELADRFDTDALASNGLRVFTTLDPRLQDHVDEAVEERLLKLEARSATAEVATDVPAESPARLQAAVVVSDTQTGELLALGGGRDARFDGFNRALRASRPIGSLMKPVVFLEALAQGFTLATQIEDRQLALTDPAGNLWTPQNFDGETRGTVSLARALAQSLNLATVQLGLTLGVEPVAKRLEQLSNAPVRNRYPSLLLGAEDMTPLAVTQLYSSFASGGFRLSPRSVVSVFDEQGQALDHRPIDFESVIDPQLNALLVHNLTLAMSHGTGRGSRHRNQRIAGKTGTSDDYRDSWFAGFDADRLAVVWIGNDDNRSTGLTGAGGALKLWDDVMASRPLSAVPTVYPEATASVDFDTGFRLSADCVAGNRIELPFLAEPELRLHPDCSGGAGDRLRRWLKSARDDLAGVAQ